MGDTKKIVEVDEEDDLSFEDMGLDPRLIRSLAKKDITKPTAIQLKAIPLILVSYLAMTSHYFAFF
jgi:superfamily II DNA/RNA helicase